MNVNLTLLLAELVNAREEAGMTQEALGDRLGVRRLTVCHWEVGRSKPDLDTLFAWADILHYDLTLTPREGDRAPVRGLRDRIRWRPGKAAS